MKKIFYYLFICFGVVSLFSCNNNNSTKEPTPEKTPTEEVSYNKNAESNLEENVDFISHAATYDGTKFSYDQSKWYVNNLDKVPYLIHISIMKMVCFILLVHVICQLI